MNPFGMLADALISGSVSLCLVTAALQRVYLESTLWIFVASVAFYLLSRVFRGVRPSLFLLFFISLMLFGWTSYNVGIFAGVMETLAWSLFFFRRTSFIRQGLDNELQMRRIFIDIAVSLASYFFAYGLMSLAPVALWKPVSVLFALATVTRIGALRYAQVASARAEGVTYVAMMRRPLLTISTISIVAIWAFWTLPAFRIVIILGVVLYVVWLMLQGLKRYWASIVISLLLIASLPFLLDHKGKLKGFKSLSKLSNLAKHQKQLQPHSSPLMHNILVWGGIILGVLILTLVVVWIMRQTKQLDPISALPVPDAMITRSRLEEDTSPSAPLTPIRRLVRQWLESERAQGHPIMRGQTLRQHTVSPQSKGAEFDQILEEMTERYERERYGDQENPTESVQSLVQKLTTTGRLKSARTIRSINRQKKDGPRHM